MTNDQIEHLSHTIINHAIDNEIESDIATIRSHRWQATNVNGSSYTNDDYCDLDGQRPYGPEGLIQDVDGEEVSVIIYTNKNLHVVELELIKDSGNPIKSPILDTIRFLI